MATTVKIMLNDKSSIEELAKDPEVQVRIKTAIVDEIGKRAAKAAQAALDKSVERAVEFAMTRFLKGKPNDVIKQGLWDRIVLSDKMMAAIQNAVNSKLTIAAFEYVDKLPENEKLKKTLQKQINHVNEVDIDEMIRRSVDRIVREKFGGK